jgi:hypothetical protein
LGTSDSILKILVAASSVRVITATDASGSLTMRSLRESAKAIIKCPSFGHNVTVTGTPSLIDFGISRGA